MKTVAIEELMVSCVLTFCENLAELGCPKDKDPCIWFRELCYDNMDEALKVCDKILEIQERYINEE